MLELDGKREWRMNLREQLGLWISSLRSRFLLFPSFPLINFILDFGFPFSSQCKHVDFCSWTKPRKQGANELRMALLKETDPSSRFLNVYSLWHPNYFLLAEWKGKICFLRWGNETFRFLEEPPHLRCKLMSLNISIMYTELQKHMSWPIAASNWWEILPKNMSAGLRGLSYKT